MRGRGERGEGKEGEKQQLTGREGSFFGGGDKEDKQQLMGREACKEGSLKQQLSLNSVLCVTGS